MTHSFSTLIAAFFLACAMPLQAATFAGRDDVAQFIDDMATAHGFDRNMLLTLFARTHPVERVVRLIMPPADPRVRSWQAYRSRFVEPKRIAAGRRFMQQHQAALARAESETGVPASIIAAIIGVETIYGRHMGDFGTFAALATLAFDYPPRAALFRRELGELLLLAREEGRDPLAYRGSYAGAMGLPQFLPSSRRHYAVDHDGDGRIDLTGSPADAIGSVANFLREHGWEAGAPVTDRVIVAGEGLPAAISAGIAPSRTPDEWQAAGLTLRKVGQPSPSFPLPEREREANGTSLPERERGFGGTAPGAEFPARAAAMIDLVTPDAPTEYRLGYRNFWVITRYNRSSFYAAAVADLAGVLER